ncbi:formimidoylglutamate deiminase [Kibdelosporangium philippinense]|uniref:Formimidoylglutamate deiminase n=1 Tax=Kibdelosporangium philippinense TaxID=211113 RepID=A0ABS8ZE74_9PSEU|nr:formimidoylglutamate deiminase [Kibdelosporangium philippinense]MCE7006128.1 formimidoylglutamate deiminase [Kibdelosporangium philippinense]
MRYWCEHAWLDSSGVRSSVVVDVADGRITAVVPDSPCPPDAHRLTGLVLPGFANAHSHAFHRALRGRTHADGGTFWTWRTGMYSLASKLDPDSYLKLATAVYAEMALAGVTCVGEFHYVHHAPGGSRYADPNAMSEALREAASLAGIRVTLLDTCYLAGGIDQPLDPSQLRFSDGSVDAWTSRVSSLRSDSTLLAGAAIHSVRAVPRSSLSALVSAWPTGPLHVHLSEQPAENEACLSAYGLSPTELLAEAGALSPRTTAVHATHLSTKDISLLGSSGTGACFCPTTEADLADGIGPARELVDAGSPLSLGSDQHAVIDPLLEARALEHGERLRTGQRGRFTPAELFSALTAHASLGWQPGFADLVAISLDTPRTAGCLPEQAMLVATGADVHTVIASGKVIVEDGHHRVGDVGRLLAAAIEELWR